MVQNALKIAGGVSRLAAITTLPKRLKSNLFGCIRIGITAAGMYMGYLPKDRFPDSFSRLIQPNQLRWIKIQRRHGLDKMVA